MDLRTYSFVLGTRYRVWGALELFLDACHFASRRSGPPSDYQMHAYIVVRPLDRCP